MDFKKSVDCRVLNHENVHGDLFDMTVESPYIASRTQAGQFLHIRVSGGYLRRPISICDVEGDTVRFLYEVKGAGLRSLSELVPGDSVNILGPLGNGFDLSIPAENPYVVGGGIGIFPLYHIAKLKEVKAVLGFRTKELVCMEDDFKAACTSLQIATDDGSKGIHGNVCDLLEQAIQSGDKPDVIYACGPMPMLKAVSQLAKQHHIRAQVSLEERMACGIGACLGCACKTKADDGTEEYLHVCKDGPVFEADQIVFE